MQTWAHRCAPAGSFGIAGGTNLPDESVGKSWAHKWLELGWPLKFWETREGTETILIHCFYHFRERKGREEARRGCLYVPRPARLPQIVSQKVHHLRDPDMTQQTTYNGAPRTHHPPTGCTTPAHAAGLLGVLMFYWAWRGPSPVCIYTIYYIFDRTCMVQ